MPPAVCAVVYGFGDGDMVVWVWVVPLNIGWPSGVKVSPIGPNALRLLDG